jgi:hypothetical protein
VQIGHVCLAVGARWGPRAAASHLVVLGVPSAAHLWSALARLRAAGIGLTVFHEPDDGLGDTAAATEPVTANRRRLFRHYPLWQPPRGPPVR